MDFCIKKRKKEKKPNLEGCGGCGSGNSKVQVMVLTECENCGRKKARSTIMWVEAEQPLPEMREG